VNLVLAIHLCSDTERSLLIKRKLSRLPVWLGTIYHHISVLFKSIEVDMLYIEVKILSEDSSLISFYSSLCNI
jgi:hypothetical protein